MSRIMEHFTYAHLPHHLQDISKPFCDMAHLVFRQLPENAERTMCLRKLLEAKDCAVRAYIEGHGSAIRPVAGADRDELMTAMQMQEASSERAARAEAALSQGYRRIDPETIPNKDK